MQKKRYENVLKNGKNLESIVKRENRFEKPAVVSPEETLPIAEKYLQALFPEYTWVFEGYGPVKFNWHSKDCISVSKNDSAYLESNWSRIENGIRISKEIRIGVNVVDGKVHFTSIPVNITKSKLPTVCAEITSEQAIAIAKNAFLEPNGLFDKNFHIEKEEIQKNQTKKEELFDRYFCIDKKNVKLRFKYSDRNLFLKEQYENGKYDVKHMYESKNSFLKDILIYECIVSYNKKSFCGTAFEFFIDAVTGEVISSHYKYKGLPESSTYLQEHYKEVKPEIIRNKYYYNTYIPHAEINEKILTELGITQQKEILTIPKLKKER